MEFCTYITFYKGNKMPPFYIGYTSVSNIVENNYHGSVGSQKYSKIWKSEIRSNRNLFKTVILTRHKNRKEAIEKEIYFQEFFNAHTNPMYINMSIHNERFYHSGPHSEKTREKISIANKGKKNSKEQNERISKALAGKNKSDYHKKKISETKNNIEWIESIGKKVAKRSSEIQNDPDWKATVGKEKVRKDLEKKYDPTWKATVGKSAKQKELATKNDPTWKENVGVVAAKKCSDTKNSLEWKETKGKVVAQKLSEKQNSAEWKAANFKCCEVCGKQDISPGNYNRWHGINCRKR